MANRQEMTGHGVGSERGMGVDRGRVVGARLVRARVEVLTDGVGGWWVESVVGDDPRTYTERVSGPYGAARAAIEAVNLTWPDLEPEKTDPSRDGSEGSVADNSGERVRPRNGSGWVGSSTRRWLAAVMEAEESDELDVEEGYSTISPGQLLHLAMRVHGGVEGEPLCCDDGDDARRVAVIAARRVLTSPAAARCRAALAQVQEGRGAEGLAAVGCALEAAAELSGFGATGSGRGWL